MNETLHAPLSDGDLWRVLEGQAGDEIVEHVDGCATCQATLEVLRAMDTNLNLVAELDRCPSAETLVAFGDGGLEAALGERVHLHLEHCPSCGDELARYRRFADKTEKDFRRSPISEPVADRKSVNSDGQGNILEDIWNTVFPPQPSLVLQPILVRGDAEVQWQSLGGFRLSLVVDGNNRLPQRYRLSGGLAGAIAGPVTVHLWLGDSLVATTVAEDLSGLAIDDAEAERTLRFTFAELGPGDYHLTFALDGQELRRPGTVKVGD